MFSSFAYQILTRRLVALEQDRAPHVLMGEIGLPLVQFLDEFVVLARVFPRTSAPVVLDSSPRDSAPKIMGLYQCCE